MAVIGFGDIGSAAAKALQGRFAHVIVHDIDPTRQASAWLQGFRVGSLHEALSTSNLILGCSGSRSLTREALDLAPDGAVLVSGSSKQVEIEVEAFLDAENGIGVRGDLIVRDYGGRRHFLLNEGKPINFVDGSAIGSTLDLVYTELYACTRALAQRRVAAQGLTGLSTRECDSLARDWLSIYAEAHRPNLHTVSAGVSC